MAARSLRADAFASVSRIIEAARRVFATGDGLGTLNRIAQEAGVGIATLYRHFPNREALARAVYDRVFTTEIDPLFQEFERSDAPRDVLLDIAEQILRVLERERGLAASLGDIAEATRDLLRRSGTLFESAVRRAQAAGNLRPDIVPGDIPNILGMVAAGFGGATSDSATRRRYVSLFLDGLNPERAQPLPSSPADPERGSR